MLMSGDIMMDGFSFESSLGCSRSQKIVAGSVGVLLVIAAFVLIPYAMVPLIVVPSYMTAFGACMIVSNGLLASLLLSKGYSERNNDSIRLGVAYGFVALIFFPLMASFQGGILPNVALIGTPVTSVWLWSYWHAGFGLLVIWYAVSARLRQQRLLRPVVAILVVVAVIAVLTASATVWIGDMPSILEDGKTFFTGLHTLIPYSIMAVDLTAFVLIVSLRLRTIEQLWLAIGMIAACFDVLLTFKGAARFSVGWYLSKVASLATTMVVLISVCFSISALYKSVIRINLTLKDIATQDGLTGIANRVELDRRLNEEYRRAARGGTPLSFLMIDVDLFKTYNDTYGHLGGDECLRRVAGVLAATASRPGDTVARYGGEEFAVILPATDNAGAVAIAEKIRRGIAAADIEHVGSASGRLTVSVGVSTTVPTSVSALTDLIAAADAALYRAKRAGRDRTVLAA